MSLTVQNTRAEAPRVALFGMLDDGSFAAEVLDETGVPYTAYWDNAIDQVVVYIEPEKEELEAIISALNEGRLDFDHLQDFGGTDGGSSILPI